MSVEPLRAVRAILLDDATLSTAVSSRIYGHELPQKESEVKAMPRASVVLKAAGGPANPGGGYQDYGKTRVDVICYGASLDESWQVYLAAYSALKAIQRVKSQGVLVHSAEVSSKGATARDPVTQWPVTYSSWLVTASEVTAA